MIEKIPLYPEYEIEEVSDDVIILSSVIYIHKDLEDFINVYLFPIEGTYVARTKPEKDLVIKAHLRECFRTSKYLDMKSFDTSPYPLVINLYKREDDFLHKLHFKYP